MTGIGKKLEKERLELLKISKLEIKTTQDNTLPKLLLGQYSDWHNGYFIAVCNKT